jgi:FkbM family methyltransferase
MPSERVHGELVAATAGRGITCVRAACGDRPGAADLYVVEGLDELSSLHRRDLASHGMTMTALETVDVTTVDAYCAAQGIERVDYLKVDAEGHDLAVLQGAAGMLEVGVRFVQFEFGGGNIDSRTFVRDFVRLLEPRYRVSRMLTDGLEAVEYSERDEVFLTTNFLAELLDEARTGRSTTD